MMCENNLKTETKIKLFNYLSTFITENKLNKFEELIKNRTRYITVVLEDIYQPHNASAVLRTCDCLGIQDYRFTDIGNITSADCFGFQRFTNSYLRFSG